MSQSSRFLNEVSVVAHTVAADNEFHNGTHLTEKSLPSVSVRCSGKNFVTMATSSALGRLLE